VSVIKIIEIPEWEERNLMKNKFSFVILVLLMTFFLCLTGCGGEEEQGGTSPAIDVEGAYHGTMTITKVEIVYDSDDDGTVEYYQPEGESEWIGESAELSYQVTLDGEEMTLTPMEGDAMSFVGSYLLDKNEFVSTVPGEDGFDDTVLALQFFEEASAIKCRGTIVQKHTETGWANEMTLELSKTE
jgi:hypothetical protein